MSDAVIVVLVGGTILWIIVMLLLWNHSQREPRRTNKPLFTAEERQQMLARWRAQNTVD